MAWKRGPSRNGRCIHRAEGEWHAGVRKGRVYREGIWGYREWGLRDKSSMLGVGDRAWRTCSGQREEVKPGERLDTRPGQLFNPNDFACPSSPCIFGPRKEGGGDAGAAKNRGCPCPFPQAGHPSACLWGCCGVWRRGADPASSLWRLALLLFVSQPYRDRKRLQGWGTMAHSPGVCACGGAIGDTGWWPEGTTS